MRTSPAFQFYAKDWLVDTAGLSLEAQGAYARLLAHMWIEGPLPDDRTALARRCGESPRRFGVIWKAIGPLFQCTGGVLTNKRLEQERAKQDAYRQEQALRGQHGASKRWGKAPAIAPAMPSAIPAPLPEGWPEDGSPYSIPQLQDRSLLEASDELNDEDRKADRRRVAFKTVLEQPSRGAA